MTSLSPTERRHGRIVLMCLIGFFATFMVVDAVMVTIAIRTQPGVVTHQAYERGLAYNTAIAAANAQTERGWNGDITLDGNILRFTLRDRDGTPLSNAHVSGRLIRPVVDGMDQDLLFTDIGNGIYQTNLVAPAPGQWNVMINALYNHVPFTLRQSFVLQ
jgi:nitrogen fixation protein FixH